MQIKRSAAVTLLSLALCAILLLCGCGAAPKAQEAANVSADAAPSTQTANIPAAVSDEQTPGPEGTGADNGKDAVGYDLADYYNTMTAEITGTDTELTEAFLAATDAGKDYVNDAGLVNTLEQSIIPGSQALLQKAETVQPKTDAVKSLHDIYMEYLTLRNKAFITLTKALDQQDKNAADSAYAIYQQANQKGAEYSEKLLQLMQEYNLTGTDGPIESTAASSPEDIKKDLDNYLNNQLVSIFETEKSVTEMFDAIVGDNYQGDAIMYSELKVKIIPESLSLIEQAEAIVPKTPEIQELHAIYLEYVHLQNKAFTTLMDALYEQDSEKIGSVNGFIDEAKAKSAEFANAVDMMAQNYGVQIR